MGGNPFIVVIEFDRIVVGLEDVPESETQSVETGGAVADFAAVAGVQAGISELTVHHVVVGRTGQVPGAEPAVAGRERAAQLHGAKAAAQRQVGRPRKHRGLGGARGRVDLGLQVEGGLHAATQVFGAAVTDAAAAVREG